MRDTTDACCVIEAVPYSPQYGLVDRAAVAKAGGEEVDPPAQAADGESEFPAQFVEVPAAAVLQFPALEQSPDALVGIEFRRIGGQPLQMQALAGTCCQEVLDRLAAVDRCPIPDDQEPAPDLAQELAEERHDRRPTERHLLDVGEEATIRR